MVSKKRVHNTNISSVVYHRVNNSIIAIVFYKSGLMGFGVSRCEKGDKWNERIGRLRALKTAHPLPNTTNKIMNARFKSLTEAALGVFEE